jgi:molybdopterin synthase catalytic subunit
MEVDIRYFAMIREMVGRQAERRLVPQGATAGDLFAGLVREHPRLERIRPVTMVMVNQVYVGADHPLQDGDEVALIPPVSGGAGDSFVVQAETLDPRRVEAAVADPASGATVTFIGTVRDHGRGRRVTHLEYEAYAPAAERTMAQIGDEMRSRWPVQRVAMAHRVGSLAVGEASIVISVSSAHRDAAFGACQYAIERIKEIVPIWKKEHYADGAVWIGSEHEYQMETVRLASAPAGDSG